MFCTMPFQVSQQRSCVNRQRLLTICVITLLPACDDITPSQAASLSTSLIHHKHRNVEIALRLTDDLDKTYTARFVRHFIVHSFSAK